MRIKFISLLAVAGLLTMGLSADTAWAKKKTDEAAAPAAGGVEVKTYEMAVTGLANTDAFFASVGAIANRLTAAQQKMKDASTNLNTALGVATDAPLSTAIADLMTKANGKLAIAMEGTKPVLKPADGAPANITAGIDGVNGLIAACMGVVTDATALVSEVTPLVSQAPAMVTSAPSDAAAAGISPLKIPTVLKQVGANVKVVTALPGEITNTVTAATDIINTLKSGFTPAP